MVKLLLQDDKAVFVVVEDAKALVVAMKLLLFLLYNEEVVDAVKEW